jgi:hypothetical protein
MVPDAKDPTCARLSCSASMSTSSELELDEDLLRRNRGVGRELTNENRGRSSNESRKPQLSTDCDVKGVCWSASRACVERDDSAICVIDVSDLLISNTELMRIRFC